MGQTNVLRTGVDKYKTFKHSIINRCRCSKDSDEYLKPAANNSPNCFLLAA